MPWIATSIIYTDEILIIGSGCSHTALEHDTD